MCVWQVRALAGWPGTAHTFLLHKQDGSTLPLSLKVLATRVLEQQHQAGTGKESQTVQTFGHRLLIQCGDGSILELLQVQPANKAAMTAQAFTNGLSNNALTWQDPLT